MTYKFVFDPHAQAVLPLSVHPAHPHRRRARARRIDLALVTLAVAASIFGISVIRSAARTTAPSPLGASVAGAAR